MKRRTPKKNPPFFEELEPRLLFSADIAEVPTVDAVSEEYDKEAVVAKPDSDEKNGDAAVDQPLEGEANDTPALLDDAFAVGEGSATLLDLAANDTDGEEGLDLSSISIVTAPVNGTVVVNSDGTVMYSHDGSEASSDTFTYTMTDLSGAILNTATVNLFIAEVNDTPVEVGDSYSVTKGATALLNLAATDSDVDDGFSPGSIVISSGPTNGKIAVNSDGTVLYTHDGSDTGSDSFIYTISDITGASSLTALVDISVLSASDAQVVANVDLGSMM